MINLLNALGDLVKPSGKKWIARCPIHNDKDFAMSIDQCADGSVIAHCHACGANGLDLYRHYELDLSELFGGRELDKPPIPARIIDDYKTDKIVVAIYKADTKARKHITLQDKRRYRLAVSRIEGIERKYQTI